MRSRKGLNTMDGDMSPAEVEYREVRFLMERAVHLILRDLVTQHELSNEKIICLLLRMFGKELRIRLLKERDALVKKYLGALVRE